MSNLNGALINRVCHLMFLLNSAPRTVMELCDLTGMRHNACRRWLVALQAEGLVSSRKLPYAPGQMGDRAWVWTWEGA